MLHRWRPGLVDDSTRAGDPTPPQIGPISDGCHRPLSAWIAFGSPGYLLFYFAAMMTQAAMTLLFGSAADAQTPNLGAGGAIAAVLGAYFVLYPNSRIRTFLGWLVVSVPAWIFLGGWFAYRLVEANFGLFGTGRAAAWRSSPTWAVSPSGTSSRGRWCARVGSHPRAAPACSPTD
jgi:Rhomboid family